MNTIAGCREGGEHPAPGASSVGFLSGVDERALSVQLSRLQVIRFIEALGSDYRSHVFCHTSMV